MKYTYSTYLLISVTHAKCAVTPEGHDRLQATGYRLLLQATGYNVFKSCRVQRQDLSCVLKQNGILASRAVSSNPVRDDGQFGSQEWLGNRSRKTYTLCAPAKLFTDDTRAKADLQEQTDGRACKTLGYVPEGGCATHQLVDPACKYISLSIVS